MNELQTWEHLAKKWAKAKPTVWDGGTKYYAVIVIPSIGECDGICDCLYDLHKEERITSGITERMLDRMNRHRPKGKDRSYYWWSSGKRGANARARFCHKMAALVREEMQDDK